MSTVQNTSIVHHVETPSGRVAYVQAGSGPVALFVHGVLLNKHMWRRQFDALSDVRRCIAVDLLAHGDTEIAFDQNVSVTTNAKMLKEVLDALQIDQVDLIGNDSGGGIYQIFAALNPDRVRTLTLTNCDRTTTGRPRRSNRSSKWWRRADCRRRSMRCSATSPSIVRPARWAPLMRIRA